MQTGTHECHFQTERATEAGFHSLSIFGLGGWITVPSGDSYMICSSNCGLSAFGSNSPPHGTPLPLRPLSPASRLEQRQLFLDVAGRPSRGGATLGRSQGSPERSESVTVTTGDPGAQGHDRNFALKPLHQQWCLVGTVRNPR